ncbi:MAG: hypothetical protein ACRCXA_04780 [Peptostreptococcaceae bacterium]
MDKSLIEYLINVLVFTPFVLLLVVLSIKMSKRNIEKFTSNKYVQVLERINVSKDNNIYLLKTGDTGCVVMSSHNHTEKIKDLSEEEIEQILLSKQSLNKEDKLWKY